MLRIGQGCDAHCFKSGAKLVLGGVTVPYELGLEAHSDGDVLIHALCDALLGALALGDIGQHFPDNSDDYKGIDSRILLRRVIELVHKKNYQSGNVDMMIIAQSPKMDWHLPGMSENLAADMQTSIDNVSIKATPTEKMGFTGRGEGIAAQAVVLLKVNPLA